VRAWWSRAGEVLANAFWLLPALMVGVGVLLGAVLPLVEVSVGVRLVGQPESARAILATIATVTVSVAGLALSVMVVALVLASQQFSPRVMRTFRSRKLNQVVLGMFVATFVYSLLVLRTVGTGADDTYVPDISVLVAVVAAIAAFGLFIAFVGQMVYALEASSIIKRIAEEARAGVSRPYPTGVGHPPRDLAAAERRVGGRRGQAGLEVTSPSAGYLLNVRGAEIIEAAAEHDALVAQEIMIGDFVVSGDVVARVWCADDACEDVERRVLGAVELGPERTPLHDIRFPIRQLADVALRGVSPSTNDPTTAANAMNSLTDTIVRIARQERPAAVRLDDRGVERLITRTPDLDHMVRLGFEQVRVKASTYPVLCAHLLELLARIDAAAPGGCAECHRQARLVVESVGEASLISEDIEAVERCHEELFGDARTSQAARPPTAS